MADRIPTAAEVQAAVARVYARPEFQERHTWQEWLMARVARAFAWLGDRLSWLDGLRTTHPVLFWLILAWLVAALVALVGHIVWTAAKVARRAEGGGTAAAKEAGPPRPRGAAGWEAEAARLAGLGRLREAAAALYQALLLRLDALGAVRWDASKTPGDYRREARRHPEAARALGGFLRLFEPVAFGGRDLDAEGWERLKTAAADGSARG